MISYFFFQIFKAIFFHLFTNIYAHCAEQIIFNKSLHYSPSLTSRNFKKKKKKSILYYFNRNLLASIFQGFILHLDLKILKIDIIPRLLFFKGSVKLINE